MDHTTYVKVREAGRIVSVAVIVAMAANSDDLLEVLERGASLGDRAAFATAGEDRAQGQPLQYRPLLESGWQTTTQ